MTGQNRNGIDIVLAESLKELAETRPLEKVTIKEITDKAGVIRPTFYNHFQDKYELIEWIINTELLEPADPLIRAGMIKEAMTLILTNLLKDKIFYEKAVKLEGAVTFHDIAMKCMAQMLLGIFNELSEGKKPKFEFLTPGALSVYYAQAICFAAEQWISQGMNIPPREVADAFYYIMNTSLDDVLKDM